MGSPSPSWEEYQALFTDACINFSPGEILSLSGDNRRFYVDASLTKGNCGTLAMDLFDNTQFYGMYIGITDSGENEVISTLEPYFVLPWLKYALPYFVESNKVAEVTEYLQVWALLRCPRLAVN